MTRYDSGEKERKKEKPMLQFDLGIFIFNREMIDRYGLIRSFSFLSFFDGNLADQRHLLEDRVNSNSNACEYEQARTSHSGAMAPYLEGSAENVRRGQIFPSE